MTYIPASLKLIICLLLRVKVWKSVTFFFCYQHFFFHTQHHNTTSIKKQTKKKHTQYPKSPVKREGEREGQGKHKTSNYFIWSRMLKKKHCQASMVEGLAPLIRAVVHSQDTICRRLWIQYVFPHMCGVNQFCIIVFFAAVKPANNILFCIELIQRPESSLRRHKLGLTSQSICSKDGKSVTLMTLGQWLLAHSYAVESSYSRAEDRSSKVFWFHFHSLSGNISGLLPWLTHSQILTDLATE